MEKKNEDKKGGSFSKEAINLPVLAGLCRRCLNKLSLKVFSSFKQSAQTLKACSNYVLFLARV